MQLPLHRHPADRCGQSSSYRPGQAMSRMGQTVGADWLARTGPQARRRDGVAAAFGRVLPRDAEHAHRLEAEREALAPVAGADVEAGQLAHALKSVTNRVAMGEERLG